MAKLQEKFGGDLPALRDDIRELVKGYGDVVLSEATVAQAYGGMRGIKSMICDTSEVSPDKGLIIRGIPLLEITDKLPEEIFWLLVTGELPNADELKDLQGDLTARAGVPSYVWDVMRAMPKDAHPMAMISVGIMAMQNLSKYAKAYAAGVKKTEYWESTTEDVLDVIAKLPELAAGIYRIRFHDGVLIPHDKTLDWGGNMAKMMGLPDPEGKLAELMRLYLTLHSDHESPVAEVYPGGNLAAQAHGDPHAGPAIARYRAGADTRDSPTAHIAPLGQLGCRRIGHVYDQPRRLPCARLSHLAGNSRRSRKTRPAQPRRQSRLGQALPRPHRDD